MLSERLISICKTEAAKVGVRPDIHPEDFIFQFCLTNPVFQSHEENAIKYYFENGLDSARKLRYLIEEICGYDGKQKIRLLEFASGFGCVTRHLRNVLPFAETVSCDIHPGAMQFLKDQLGMEVVRSTPRPEDLVMDGKFDVVFALSFFSHMPKSSFLRWLDRLISFTKPGGHIIFTTHGAESKKYLANGPFDEEGFSFFPSSEQKDLDGAEYGSTDSLPHYVIANIFNVPSCRLKYFHEAHWWGHQDVYVLQKCEYEFRPSVNHVGTEGKAAAAPAAPQIPPDEREGKIQALDAELAEIKSSRGWIVFQWLRRERVKLVPYGSKRERWMRVAFDQFRAWRSKIAGRRSVSPRKDIPIQKNKTVRDLAKGWKDDKYLALLLESVDRPYIDGIKMPGFPSEQIQRNFVGSAREQALREGYTFYQTVKRYCARLGVPLNAGTRVLDFGCGWGRIARFFFKDVDGNNFYGVDVDPTMVAFCASEMTCGRYETVHSEPPMEFLKDRSVDVIFAYSVFSHLAEPVARKWIEEFARVLRPGGILLATTQARAFMDFCESLRAKHEEPENVWWKGLARSFTPIEKAKADYESGKFLFSSTGGGVYRDKSFYGEAIISKQYVEREYSRFLTFRDFVDDTAVLPQALFVMQKPG